MQLKLLSLLLFLGLVTGCSEEPKETTIKGEITGFTTESILLIRPYEDLRFDNIIEIPVVDGFFEHKVQLKAPEGFYLLIGDAKNSAGGRMMPLFLEEGTIDLKIFPEDDFKNNLIKGGKLNDEYLDYSRQLGDQEFQNWQEQQEWTHNYINKNTNLTSYFLLLQELTSGWEIDDLTFHRQSFKKLASAFPNHPYSDLVDDLLEGHMSKIGKKFIDFSAPDLDGNTVTLSDQIEGKVSLVNLWATWCAPCIRKSREIIPVIERYQEKGFTVVGVAGEFRSTENLRNFLAKKEFPWLNLVELDRQNNLWVKYGIPRSGGGMFLIGRDGKILMKDPTPEELEEKLAELF